jgi:hypothetical protein
MAVDIRVYPNKLDLDSFEPSQCKAGLTIEGWLIGAVPSYESREVPLMSIELNGFLIEPDLWPLTVLKDGNCVACYVEPKGVETIIMVTIAVLSAAAAIYYANQSIPDTYNSTIPKGSPVYSVNAQGNQPRLMGVVPEGFGRHKYFPDYLNQIHREYVGHEEYLNLMMAVGVGSYTIDPSTINIGDTPITNYSDDIDYQIFAPGVNVSGHVAHRNIHTSKEVGGSSGQSGFDLEGPTAQINSGTNTDGFGSDSTVLGVAYDESDTGPSYYSYTQLTQFVVGDIVEIFDSLASFNGYFKVVAQNVSFKGIGDKGTKFARIDKDTLLVIESVNVFPTTDNVNLNIRGVVPGGAGDYVGSFSAAPQSVFIDSFYVDIKFPSGLCILNSAGNPTSHTVDLRISYSINEGASYSSVIRSFTDATVDARAYTVEIPLTSGTGCLVRIERMTVETDDIKYKEKCQWTGLKSELEAATNYPDITTIAIRIKGTNALASTAENKVNLIGSRHLNTWSAGVFGQVTATTDIAPVVKYLADQAGLEVDMVELKRLHDLWTGRGDQFNAIFDNATTTWEALKRILAVGFSEPTLDFGSLVPVRDEQRSNIEFMYSPQNTLPNSWNMTASFISADEKDGVEVEYMDSVTWKSETVLCLLPGDAGDNLDRVRAYGVTDRDKAYQYGMRKRSEMRYRRIQHKFSTEMDGLNSNYLSRDALAIDMPGYSQTGEVSSVAGRDLVLNEDVEFEAGQTHYICIRKPNGSSSGPYICTAGSESNEITINTDLDFVPVFNGKQEPPFFMFGTADEWCETVLIKDISPAGTDRVNLTAVNDDARVYLFDDALAPL